MEEVPVFLRRRKTRIGRHTIWVAVDIRWLGTVGTTVMLAAFAYKLFYIRRREQAPALHWIDVFPRYPIFTQVCVFLRKFHWEVVHKRQLQHPKQWGQGGIIPPCRGVGVEPPQKIPRHKHVGRRRFDVTQLGRH